MCLFVRGAFKSIFYVVVLEKNLRIESMSDLETKRRRSATLAGEKSSARATLHIVVGSTNGVKVMTVEAAFRRAFF